VLDLPTAYWHAWIPGVDSAYLARSAIRLVIVGGEAVSAESFRHWGRIALPHQAWINAYGPTEATIGCSAQRYASAEAAREESAAAVPIGRPIANAQMYLLD